MNNKDVCEGSISGKFPDKISLGKPRPHLSFMLFLTADHKTDAFIGYAVLSCHLSQLQFFCHQDSRTKNDH